MPTIPLVFALLSLLLLSGSGVPVAPAAPLLDRCDLVSPALTHQVPGRYREVSGLAATAKGTVFFHADERARVAELDLSTGLITREFELEGRPADDFEGIALRDSVLFLMTSTGRLYEFLPPDSGSQAPYRITETGFGKPCELEGLAWDERAGVFLLPCKQAHDVRIRRLLVLARWSPASGGPASPATLSIDGTVLRRAVGAPEVRATAVEVDPVTGHYLVLSSRPTAVIELTPGGELVRAVPLDAARHQMPEGLALSGDLLVIGDEGRPAGTIIVYACRR